MIAWLFNKIFPINPGSECVTNQIVSDLDNLGFVSWQGKIEYLMSVSTYNIIFIFISVSDISVSNIRVKRFAIKGINEDYFSYWQKRRLIKAINKKLYRQDLIENAKSQDDIIAAVKTKFPNCF